MAAADRSYCEVQLDVEENYCGECHVEQDVVQNSTTPNENGCYSFGQESPASFMSALLELSTLARGAQEMSVEEIAGTAASLDIFRVIAQISVTTRETMVDRAKGPKFGPALLSTAPVSKSWYSSWK